MASCSAVLLLAMVLAWPQQRHILALVEPYLTAYLQVDRRDFYTGTDASLAAFLASMQQLGSRCASTVCSDGPSAHLVSYLHGNGLISFSVTRLPQAKALPGVDHGQIWFWARPQEVSRFIVHICWFFLYRHKLSIVA